ncbi:MAG: hypothetical protein AAFN79_00715 [Pseudomonadota bacterium]
MSRKTGPAIACIAALLAFSGGAFAQSASADALTILRGLTKGGEPTAAQYDVLERSFVISRLTRNERVALTKRIREDGLDLPPGIETALIASASRNFNNQ